MDNKVQYCLQLKSEWNCPVSLEYQFIEIRIISPHEEFPNGSWVSCADLEGRVHEVHTFHEIKEDQEITFTKCPLVLNGEINEEHIVVQKDQYVLKSEFQLERVKQISDTFDYDQNKLGANDKQINQRNLILCNKLKDICIGNPRKISLEYHQISKAAKLNDEQGSVVIFSNLPS